jgi:hypothetical protein
MAKGKKTGGRDFNGVPGPGRPPIPPEVKALRKLTAERLEEIGDLILDGNRSALGTIAASMTEPAIRVIYAKAALNAMIKGDVAVLELILNRVIGKPKDTLKLTGPNDGAVLIHNSFSIGAEERVELILGKK